MDQANELLRRFAEEGSQAAFTELVRLKVDLVFAAALRQTGGDVHLAQDVTQGVFTALALRAAPLARHAVLTGWLFTTTRFLAIRAMRRQRRWQRREQEANTMNLPTDGNDRAWTELRPVIDEAMHELNERDRGAILLRYFESKPLAAVGAALGLTENAARMRVDRALERLRVRLARRGITSTAVALGATMAGQPLVTAPAGWATTVAGVSLAGAAVTGSMLVLPWATLNFMHTTKFATGVVGAVVALGLGVYLGTRYQAALPATKEVAPVNAVQNAMLATLRNENRRLANELARATAVSAPAAPSGAWRVLADLKRKKMAEIDPKLTWVSGAGKLNETFTKLFELSPAETAALQEALNGASRRIELLQRENSTVTPRQKAAITITLRPFPTSGGAVYDGLMESFAGILGPERHAAFLTLGAERLDAAFAHFGAEERMVTFFYRPGLLNGPYLAAGWVRIGAEQIDTPGDYRSRQDIEDHLGTIAHLIPPDFDGEK